MLPLKRLLTLSLMCWAVDGFAQSRFNYQAVVREANDTIVPNHHVLVELTLHADSEPGAIVFQETHDDTTSSLGLLNLLVGSGEPNTAYDPLDSVDWGAHQYFLEVRVNLLDGEGFREMGTAPVASVPIAEYARNGGKPWSNNTTGIHYVEGNVGVGTDSPSAPLEVRSHLKIAGDTLGSERISLVAGDSLLDNHISAYDELGVRKWVLNMLDRSHSNSFGLFSDDVQQYTLRVKNSGQVELKAPNISQKLSLFASDGYDNWIESFAGSERKWLINMFDEDVDGRFGIYSDDAVTNGLPGYLLLIQPDGRTQVRCLEILGGCDINERFNSVETLEPGTVVIADPERPGQVCTTERSYDQRVVGAISGANGIKPGLTLTQEDTSLDGTHPVALDGRVYVKVTGQVEVGDLLTTSNEPGKAMAAKNRRKAFGAVVGKALESDADGDGFVLMLVQPR